MMATPPQIVVGMAEGGVARAPIEQIVTYSLGSCIGVCLFDQRLKIGALLHFQLPESKINPEKAAQCPYMFADTGLVRILEAMKALGAREAQLRVVLAGGAAMQQGSGHFEIGKRNAIAIRKALWKAGLLIAGSDLGGTSPRTLYLNLLAGQVAIKSAGTIKRL